MTDPGVDIEVTQGFRTRIFGRKLEREPQKSTFSLEGRKATVEEGADRHAGETVTTPIGSIYGKKLGGSAPTENDPGTPRIY